jgi:hypothetical protein
MKVPGEHVTTQGGQVMLNVELVVVIVIATAHCADLSESPEDFWLVFKFLEHAVRFDRGGSSDTSPKRPLLGLSMRSLHHQCDLRSLFCMA